MIQLTVEKVAALQGNALMVLTILALEKGPRSQDWLMAVTGMSDKTLHQAVEKLRVFGYVVETKMRLPGPAARWQYAYQIADGMVQLPLMAEELPPPVHGDVVDGVVRDGGEEGGDPDPEPNRNFSDLDHACMHDSESIPPEEPGDEPACMPGAERKNSDLEGALQEAGIREPALSRLRQRRGLTARVVRYHVAHAPSLGAAITRIEQNWAVPANWERAGPDGNEYIGGEYAGIIQH